MVITVSITDRTIRCDIFASMWIERRDALRGAGRPVNGADEKVPGGDCDLRRAVTETTCLGFGSQLFRANNCQSGQPIGDEQSTSLSQRAHRFIIGGMCNRYRMTAKQAD